MIDRYSIKSFSSGVLNTIFSATFSFLSIKYIISTSDLSSYGLWALILIPQGLAIFATLGIPRAIVQNLSEAPNKSAYLRTCFRIFVIIISFLTIMGATSIALNARYTILEISMHTAIVSMLAIYLFISFEFLKGLYEAYDRVPITNLFSLFSTVSIYTGAIVGTSFGGVLAMQVGTVSFLSVVVGAFTLISRKFVVLDDSDEKVSSYHVLSNARPFILLTVTNSLVVPINRIFVGLYDESGKSHAVFDIIIKISLMALTLTNSLAIHLHGYLRNRIQSIDSLKSTFRIYTISMFFLWIFGLILFLFVDEYIYHFLIIDLQYHSLMTLSVIFISFTALCEPSSKILWSVGLVDITTIIRAFQVAANALALFLFSSNSVVHVGVYSYALPLNLSSAVIIFSTYIVLWRNKLPWKTIDK